MTALWPLPIFWTDSEDVSGNVYGDSSWEFARDVAIYHALEKVPKADALLSPRFWRTKKSKGIWWSNTCVTVKAKALRLKKDVSLREKLPRKPPVIEVKKAHKSRMVKKARTGPGRRGRKRAKKHAPKEAGTAAKTPPRPKCDAVCSRFVRAVHGSKSLKEPIRTRCMERCRAGDLKFSVCAWRAKTMADVSRCMGIED